MSTMTLRGPLAPAKSGVFSRLYQAILIWIEVFSEAQRMAREAERRFACSHW